MALDRRDTVPIPGPRALPIIGNALDVASEVPIERIAALGRQYGEIFSLWLGGRRTNFISSHALMNELCDERRFVKRTGGPLAELRNGVHDGLFTANDGEENWGIAHRVLTPAFGPLPIVGMFDSMKDIAAQLVMKLARFGDSYRMPVTDDFTRLTLDTLALCAMDYRFNSFYAEEMHPFVDAMVAFLGYASIRARRPAFLHSWYAAEENKWHENIHYMRNLSTQLVQERKDHPKDTKDLLNAMLHGKDPKTGKHITEESVVDNLITFLIAGHETTSGMLSYAFYCLLKNPDAYRKAQQEVDSVIGKESVLEVHLRKLPYITAVLRETGRLHSTAPAFSVSPKSEQGETLGGKYHIPHGETAAIILHNVHRDPAVYGDDADDFRPERMLEENFVKLSENAWKPFGNGSRGCIGRGFATQEMMLVMAMLLQYFDFTMDDPGYTLETAFSLTIKPKNFFMKTTLREGWTARKIEAHLSGSLQPQPQDSSAKPSNEPTSAAMESKKPGQPLTILYGSNSGTCQVFAETLAANARAHGFTASRLDTLDSAKNNLPSEEPVVIVTASYEGEPCDNAALFFNWIQNNDEKIKTKFAVFGCGHSDWKQTFHKVPIKIDQLLEEAGGQRLCAMGSANAAKGDMMSEFQEWEDGFWTALQREFGEEGAKSSSVPYGENITIEVSNKRASHLRSDVSEAKVVAARALTSTGVGEKRHIELQLPSGMQYRAGDYLAILPLNPPETVHRVLKRFSLPWDAMLKISSRTQTNLPTDHPISAHDLFSAYLELAQPATKRNVAMLLEASKEDPKTTAELTALTSSDAVFSQEVTEKRVSLLDLLEKHPALPLPLGAFISALISMRVRQYSISSSPMRDPDHLTLTYAVLDAPSLSDPGERRHIGVASNYMSSLQPGDIVHVATRPSHAAFRLPADPEKVPVVMIAAGAGLAPFRGFIQERAAQIGSGRKLAAAHLYFGCRHPEKDDLYREEMEFWEKMGAVTVHRSFSQAPELTGGHKHIDSVLLAQKEELIELWSLGARVYVCGSRGLGESAKEACLAIAKEQAKRLGKDDSDETLEKWFSKIRNERFSTDVFA